MIAKYLGTKGHRVNVIASQTDYMTGQNVRNEETADQEDLNLPEGVTVKRINTYFNGKSKIKRLMQYIIYCYMALFYGLSATKPDLVIATSPPIFVGLIGCWIAKMRRVKYAFEIRDPWPDALIYFGVLKKSPFTWLLYRMEMYIYRNSHLLIALTPGIKRLIVQKGISEDKIKVITNGYDDEIFEKDGRLFYPRQCTEGVSTKVLYVGSVGKINETEYMMELVTLLQDVPDIKFEFIGAGICKENMLHTARERNLTNVAILPSVPRGEVPRILATGDIAIVFTKPGLYSEIGLHNKIFDYLGVGLPVVASGGGDLRDLIEKAGAGYTVSPRDVTGAMEKIKELHYNRQLAWEMGQKGRNYIISHYRRDQLLAEYEAHLNKLVYGTQNQSVRGGVK